MAFLAFQLYVIGRKSLIKSKPTAQSATFVLSLASEDADHEVSLPSRARVASPAATPSFTVFAPPPALLLPIIISPSTSTALGPKL